jgi:hypothetical protein
MVISQHLIESIINCLLEKQPGFAISLSNGFLTEQIQIEYNRIKLGKTQRP